jgi:hypothetical protein
MSATLDARLAALKECWDKLLVLAQLTETETDAFAPLGCYPW